MTKITKFNISKPEKYTKNNEEKTVWHNIGRMTVFQKDDGSVNRIIEIPAIGLTANVFPFEDKKDKRTPIEQPEPPQEETVEYPEEEINPESVPF